MIIDIDEISKQWKLDEPQLDILGQQVVSLLKKGLFAVELHPEISYRTKEIQSIIKKIQKKQKEKTYGYNDLRDRLGIRIVCPFLSDLSTIDTFLKKNFKVRKEEKKKEKILRKLEAGKLQPSVHVITLAISEKNQLEIYPTLQFKQPAFPEQDLFVVGITKGYEEAVELVEQIVQEVYEQTGGCDIRSYILEKEQGR